MLTRFYCKPFVTSWILLCSWSFRRAGFSQAQVQLNLQLPSTVEHLLATCEVIEKSTAAPPWDFVWNATTEEGREKQMFSQAFVIDEETVVPEPIYDVDSFYVAEAAVKVSLLVCLQE